MRSLMKSALERMLNAELKVHLNEEANSRAVPEESSTEGSAQAPRKRGNRRNGTSPKSVQGDMGKLALEIPRDREGSFEPQLVAKHQRRLSGFDEKILALYAKGMTTRDIQQIVKELYGVDVSPTLISEITSDLDAEVKAWQTRRLAAVYPILFLDGIVVHIRGESGHVREHTMYVAIGVDFTGKKELLGLWLNETEGAKFWLSCLTDLKGGLKSQSQLAGGVSSKKTSRGVRKPRHARGRSLSSFSTWRAWQWEMFRKSVPLGKYCRIKPLVFSFVPR